MLTTTRKQFVLLWLLLSATFPFFLYFLNVSIPFHGDDFYHSGETKWGFPHVIFTILSVIAWLIVFLWGAIALSDDSDKKTHANFLLLVRFPIKEEESVDDSNTAKPTNFSLWGLVKRPLILLLVGLFFYNLYQHGKTIASSAIAVYNQAYLYQNSFKQATTERQGFYDKLWKTYTQKTLVANMNKETFIEVTKIIMENRADGKQLTWKWISENQHIPYEEFTRFYADLSGYIEGQREGYFQLEVKCQTIAAANNTLLDTFPNNYYNKFLKCKKIDYSYGFLSDSTNAVFATGKENIR